MKCQYCHKQDYDAEIVARRLQEEFVGDVQIHIQRGQVVVVCADEGLLSQAINRGRAIKNAVPPCCFACWQTTHQ